LENREWSRRFMAVRNNPLARWWLVGMGFTGFGMGILYVLVDLLRIPLLPGSALGAEIVTLLRFFTNDRWVFGHHSPTWKRLGQYHLANASSFVIWWSVTNILPFWGLHYLLAAIVATACSVGWSMITNFLWIWRRKAESP
jgi:putative flippase GtrA